MSTCMTVFWSIHDAPSSDLFPDTSSQDDTIHRRIVLFDSVKKVKVRTCMSPLSFNDAESQHEHDDHVPEYALTLGLLYMESIDDIREGDGERILRCWRYFLLLFKATGRKNYSIEAFTLLTQYHFLYTE